MGMGMASSPPQLGLLWRHLRAMAPTVAGVLVMMHLGEVPPAVCLFVCVLALHACLACLFVCLLTYVCLHSTDGHTGRHTSRPPNRQQTLLVSLSVW